LERPITKLAKVRRGSSGEPPSASWLADTGAVAVARNSGAGRPLTCSLRRWSAGAATSLAGTVLRIAVRTVRSMRCTAGISACQQVRTRSA
jgi:hypothetical protein